LYGNPGIGKFNLFRVSEIRRHKVIEHPRIFAFKCPDICREQARNIQWKEV
jgi:hypothetical protein